MCLGVRQQQNHRAFIMLGMRLSIPRHAIGETGARQRQDFMSSAFLSLFQMKKCYKNITI
jgi:hypothetical protein